MLMETILPIKLVGVLVFLFHLRTDQVTSDSEFYVHLHVLKRADTIFNHNQQTTRIRQHNKLLSIAGGEHEKPTADFGERIKYNTTRKRT